jgi:hypothetical protein
MAVKPWDLLRRKNYADEQVAQSRLDVCMGCDFLIKKTTTCKKCGCFMLAKTKLEKATCPIGKW